MDGPKDFALEKSDGFRKSFDVSKDFRTEFYNKY